MFKKFRRFWGWVIGALVVGPVVGILAGLLIDPNMYQNYFVNLNVWSAVITGGFLTLVGLAPSLVFIASLAALVGGSYIRNCEVLQANTQKFNQRIKTGRGQAELTKKQINDIIQGTAATPTTPATPSFVDGCERTHAYYGIYWGAYAANCISERMAGTDGRVYNLDLTSDSYISRMMYGADGFVNPLQGQPDEVAPAPAPAPDAQAQAAAANQDAPALNAAADAGGRVKPALSRRCRTT